MESYIYSSKEGFVGYFQIDNGRCYFYPYDAEPNDYVGNGDWNAYFNLERINSLSPNIPYTPTEKEMHGAMSYFLSQNTNRGKIEVLQTKKITNAGNYFTRINRGEPGLSDEQIKTSARADEVRAYDNIIESLLDIFRTVEPEPGNFNAYGNRIRELLIITCTEVEYLWKAILTAHNVPPLRRNYSTEDYIWCLPVLKLEDYEVSVPFYPDLGLFSPFKGWKRPDTTASLDWYHAYNSVKHDRGNTKNQATLEKLINSIAAIHVLLEAQYGKELFEFRLQHTFRTIFYTEQRPIWSYSEISAPTLHFNGPQWSGQKVHP